jgi:hypothetical protein
MRSPQESLIHDAAALFQLVDSVDKFVAEHQSTYTYTDATEAFLSRVRTLATKTRQQVSDIVQRPVTTPAETRQQYSDLIIEKDRWRILHTYVKPASDAHTLVLPVALINLAARHLRLVRVGEVVKLVPLLTQQLMYFHNVTSLKDLDDFVFVELPYSQGPTFFTNLTIYHELGHYAFDRMSNAQSANQPFMQLAHAMEVSFDSKLGKQLPAGKNRDWAKRVLDSWALEIFCDLFAGRFLGPAFTFALIDVLSLLGLMQNGIEITFDEEHPAPAFRLREQVKQLKRDSWWDCVAHLDSEHVRLCERLVARPLADYEFVLNQTGIPVFVETLDEIVPHIYQLIEAITPDPKAVAQDFERRRLDIEGCLLQGVVPSHLWKQGTAESPVPESIINAAYSFYLTAMPNLLNKLIDQERSELKKRSDLTGKLEGWTLKALEDYQIYTDVRKGS